jgi:hypothetical protein
VAHAAEMSAPKISAMENEPRNLTIGTLIRVAHALGSRVEIKLVRRKGTKPFEAQGKPGRRRNGRGKSQKPLEHREKFFDRDGGVAKNPTKSSEGNFGVKWNGDW